MQIRTETIAHDKLDDSDRAELKILADAVYPDKSVFPKREWDRGHICVRLWKCEQETREQETRELVSYLSICLRSARVDERPVDVGGIGGVKTHPDHRHQGHASQIIRSAIDFLKTQADFGLLVCKPELISFYESLGWKLFQGDLMVEQFGVQELFDYNNVMVLELKKSAPLQGKIDLQGPPW